MDMQLGTQETQKIYKVSELTRRIKSLLEKEFISIWVEGEISNFKRHSSGHIYFTLKDEAAQISCVFFSRENRNLKFEPKDGMHITCMGRISVYEPRGSYQIYVQRMEPKGLGALQLAFLQLKEKLEKEGLFDHARKKIIPKYPKRIGIVTSPTGAAIQDMLKIFKRRGYGLEIFLFPARVQGEAASREIVQGIEFLNQVMPALDVIISGRGGGSLEDLWPFNEEIVARAISQSHIPVISAVGHEVDWTISDWVADDRAHTPTAAAERIVMYWDELAERIRVIRDRMQNSVQIICEDKKTQFAKLKESYAFRQPLNYINQHKQRMDEWTRQLQNYIQNLLHLRNHVLKNTAGKLEVLSPLAILGRGYSITFDAQGHAITDIRQVKKGDRTLTKVKTGYIESEVKKVEEKS